MKELDILKEKRKELLSNYNEESQKQFAKNYEKYFKEKNEKKFILYDKFPERKEVLAYYKQNNNHPLHNYGYFDIKELSEIIKLLYRYSRQEIYEVLPCAIVDKKTYKIDLLFVIGPKEKIKIIKGQKIFNLQDETANNCIIINAGKDTSGPIMDLKCSRNDESRDCYDIFNAKIFHSQINIFENNIEYYNNITDTLSLKINSRDSFIAKILISITIFKKNINKTHLTNRDYSYIFYELFGDYYANIEREISEDIPRILSSHMLKRK